MNDWSEKLAEEIIREHALYGDQNGFVDMLALRLRLVREEGFTAGLGEAMSVWVRPLRPSTTAAQP